MVLRPPKNDALINTAEPLRILVASQLGTVGKSTVAANLLVPYLGCRAVHSVETTNLDASQYGVPVRQYSSSRLSELRIDLALDDDHSVVDLGASNFNSFVQQLHAANLFGAFSHCALVSDSSPRSQIEIIHTYETFRRFGMHPSKFRLILNRVSVPDARSQEEMDEAITNQFELLFHFKEQHPEFWLNPRCFVPNLADLFGSLRALNTSMREVLQDDTDYRALIRARNREGDAAGALDAAKRALVGELAVGAAFYLGIAFNELDIRNHSDNHQNGATT